MASFPAAGTGEKLTGESVDIPATRKCHSSSVPAPFITAGAALHRFPMLASCLGCITCSRLLDVSNFRLTGNRLGDRAASCLRQKEKGKGGTAGTTQLPANKQWKFSISAC